MNTPTTTTSGSARKPEVFPVPPIATVPPALPQFEGEGIQLFDKIDGDYFTIVGLPLLPLLAALRERGAIDA